MHCQTPLPPCSQKLLTTRPHLPLPYPIYACQRLPHTLPRSLCYHAPECCCCCRAALLPGHASCADAYKRCTNKGFIAITTGQVLLNQHRALMVSDFRWAASVVSGIYVPGTTTPAQDCQPRVTPGSPSLLARAGAYRQGKATVVRY